MPLVFSKLALLTRILHPENIGGDSNDARTYNPFSFAS